MVRTISHEVRRARKTYRCGLCENPIPKGSGHSAQTNTDDGEIWTFRAHTVCDKVAQEKFDHWDWDLSYSAGGAEFISYYLHPAGYRIGIDGQPTKAK